MMHMLSDFLTGHDELSLRITGSSGQLLFEQLRQPVDDKRSERRSFAIDLPSAQAGQPGQPVQVLLMLERLFNHIKSHEGVRFVTMNEMADDFDRRFPRG